MPDVKSRGRPAKRDPAPRASRRAERGEHRALYRVLLHSPEYLDLSLPAAHALHVLKLVLGLSGIDVVYPAALAADAKQDLEQLARSVADLEAGRWIRLGGPWAPPRPVVVWLRNGLFFEPSAKVASPSIRTAVEAHLRTLPRIPILDEFRAYYQLPGAPCRDTLPDSVSPTLSDTLPAPSPTPSPTPSQTPSPTPSQTPSTLSDTLPDTRAPSTEYRDTGKTSDVGGVLSTLSHALAFPPARDEKHEQGSTHEHDRPRVVDNSAASLRGNLTPRQAHPDLDGDELELAVSRELVRDIRDDFHGRLPPDLARDMFRAGSGYLYRFAVDAHAEHLWSKPHADRCRIFLAHRWPDNTPAPGPAEGS